MRYARDFADRRRVTDDKKDMNRLYAVESTPTLTGAKADHRLPLRASEIEGFARALAAALGVGLAGASSLANPSADKWVTAVAKDLQAHRGRSLVVPGDYQPAALHTLAHEINQALGNIDATVSYIPSVEIHPTDQVASIRDLAQAMDSGQVSLLVILGANPVFTAPTDLRFQERLQKVALVVHHSLYENETSAYCHWNLPEAHALESWGDARAYDGTVTIVQPLIAPLYEGRTIVEVLASLIDAQTGKSGHDLVKDYWSRAHGGKVAGWTIADSQGRPYPTFDAFWKHSLHDGFVASRGPRAEDRGPESVPQTSIVAPRSGPVPGPRTSTSDLVRRPRDHLPPGSDDLGWTIREQRLATGTAQAADENHVGSDGVGQPAPRRAAEARDR